MNVIKLYPIEHNLKLHYFTFNEQFIVHVLLIHVHKKMINWIIYLHLLAQKLSEELEENVWTWGTPPRKTCHFLQYLNTVQKSSW